MYLVILHIIIIISLAGRVLFNFYRFNQFVTEQTLRKYEYDYNNWIMDFEIILCPRMRIVIYCFMMYTYTFLLYYYICAF